jgi:O-antigen/teichoic acid export membrane protein
MRPFDLLKPKNRARLLDLVWAFVSMLGPSALQLLYTIVAARALAPSDFGYLTICVSVGTIMMALSGFGAGGLVLRQTARQPEHANRFLGQSIVWTFLTIPLIGGVSIAIMMLVSPTPMPIWLALCVGFSELVSWRIAMNCQQVFIALGQQFRVALVGMAIPFGRLIAALAVVAFSPHQTLQAFAIAYLASTFVAAVVAFWFTRSHIGRPLLHLGKLDFMGGASFAFTSFNSAIQVESDKLILAFFTTPADVGVYAVAARLMDGLFAPTRALKQTLQSRMYRAGSGGSVHVIKIAMEIVPLVLLFGLLAWIGVVVTTPVVVWLFGPKYAMLAHILPLIAALPLIRSFTEIGSELFLASDRAGFQTIMQLLTTVFRIAISTVLIALFKLDGAVIAALVSAAIVGSVYWVTAWSLLRRHNARAQQVEVAVKKES